MQDSIKGLNWEASPQLLKPLKIIIWILGGIVLGLYIHAFLYSPINTDAGFFLSVADQWRNGSVIYQDLWMKYTPLGIYLLRLCEIWSSNPQYGDYLFIVYLFNAFNAFWIYLIARKLTFSPILSALTSVVSWGLFYKYEAIHIVLEPFALFFLLVATYMALWAMRSDRFWFFIGLSVALSFLCKQYALAILPALLFWMYTMGGWRYLWRIIGLFSIGFILPIAWVLFSYYFSYQLHPAELLISWLNPQGYGNLDVLQIGKILVLFSLLSLPAILAIPLTLVEDKPKIGLKSGEEKKLLIALALAMILPLMVQQYEHYLLFLVPFAVLLVANLTKYQGKYMHLVRMALIINLLIFGGRMLHAVYQAFEKPLNGRSLQYEEASKIEKLVPSGSKVLLLTYYHQRLNFLCKYQPILPQKFGYGFPENLSDENLNIHLQAAEVIITGSYDLLQYPRYSQALDKNHFRRKYTEGDLQVWTKE